jgi:hypothetical protein
MKGSPVRASALTESLQSFPFGAWLLAGKSRGRLGGDRGGNTRPLLLVTRACGGKRRGCLHRPSSTASSDCPCRLPCFPNRQGRWRSFDAAPVHPADPLSHNHGFYSLGLPPDFLRRGHASCQSPPLRSGTASPPAWRPSTSTSSLPIMRSVWTCERLTPMPRSSSSERPSGRSSNAPRIEAP